METIQAHIQLLSDLHNRLQLLRHIPPLLLKTPVADDLTLPTKNISSYFHQLKDVSDTIRSTPVQEALRAARDSLQADATDLNPNFRREIRERK